MNYDYEEMAEALERHGWTHPARTVRAFGVLEEAVSRGELFLSYCYYSDGRRVNVGMTDDSNEDREGTTLLEALESEQ